MAGGEWPKIVGMKKRPTRSELDAAEIQTFARQIGRGTRRGGPDPNDRRYDRELQLRARHTKPEALDAFLRGDEDESPDRNEIRT